MVHLKREMAEEMEERTQDSSGEMVPGSLKDKLRHHSSHFAAMVELIPAKYYVVKEESESEPEASKYWVKKKQQKESVKDLTKKAKKLKLDPESRKTVADLQAEQHQKEKRDAEDSRDGDGGVAKSSGGGDAPRINGFSVEKVHSTSLVNLQERLKEKIETLRRKRNAPSEGETDEAITLKRQKRMEKQQQKKALRQKKKLVSGKGVVSSTGEAVPQPSRPSITDKETGKLIFSKFDFTTPIREEEKEPIGKTGKRKDYKKLLAKAEATEKKLAELKKKDEQREEELEKKLQWQKALDMARGEKLKDDPKLLKRSLKRQEKKKLKSSKQWEERKGLEKQAKERQQEKRKRNIQERVQKAKEGKMKKRAKRVGRIKPGF